MSKRKFKVGDKVVTKKAFRKYPVGSIGEVVSYGNRLYGVRFNRRDCYYYTGIELDRFVEPKTTPKKEVKKEAKFKVGDRVRVVSNRSCIEVGKEGTIISIDDTFSPDSDGRVVCVEFEDNIGGHDCGGKGKMGHCWLIRDGKLDRVEEPKKEEPKNTIVIYQRDRDVVALDKATGQKCYAHCHPDDKFDFKTGAKIAFGRLIGEPIEEKPIGKEATPKYYNGKVICTYVIKMMDHHVTVGKIYNFTDGNCKNNIGGNILCRPAVSFDDLNSRFNGDIKFIEVVE